MGRLQAGTVVLVAAITMLDAPSARQNDAVRIGDAYVAVDTEGGRWTVGCAAMRLDLVMDPVRGLRVGGIANVETGQDWDVSGSADWGLRLNDVAVAAGTREFRFLGSEAAPYRSGVRLDLGFAGRAPGTTVTRTYACYPGAPVVETWTTVDVTAGSPVRVSDVSLLRLSVAPGVVRWVTGLETDDTEGGSFTLAWDELAEGEAIALGATARSTQRHLPWFMIDAEHGELFGGLVWSGAWRTDLARAANHIDVSASLDDVTTEVAAGALELPHAFFGVTGGSIDEASHALQAFLRFGLRDGRGFEPLVTYNTWFAYGTHVDEELVLREMDAVADLGIELFVLDAGWYGMTAEPWDFTAGLGRWRADPERFPSGLGSLGDEAHARGLKFGLWVEPERVALDLIDRPGLAREAWLATAGGRYDPGDTAPRTAQLCFAGPAARAWMVDTLSALIDEARPDYLKWDNNFWINCDRAGHGHGSSDGNFAHVNGLYAVLSELRARYPELIIENCAGGGQRIDFGLLQYTDTAWMDDRSAPSARVRHELEGLSAVLPPAYLFSFVRAHEDEPIAASQDLALVFRSRMPGILGLTWRSDDLSAEDRETVRREIAAYRSIRDLLRVSSARLLTAQVPVGGSHDWDAIEHVTPDGDAVVYAFASEPAGRLLIRPVDLLPAALYEVTSLDYGPIATRRGADLMTDGIEIEPGTASRAHVLVFRRASGS